jgi:MYXO-CTERM domain-containing protein
MNSTLTRWVLGLALALVAPSLAHAQVGAYCDLGGTLAVADGTLESGEYAGSTLGVGSGFGGILGSEVELYWDSDSSGNLALAIDGTGRNCAWSGNDTVVLYLDTVPGAGFADTSGFTDSGDPGRAAVSGLNGGRSLLTFASDFGADFAIAIRADSATLFRLRAGASHDVVTSLTRAPSTGFGTSCVKELAGFTLAQLGSQPGNPIRFVGTVLDPSQNPPFRANELQGAATAPAMNLGGTAYTFAAGNRNTFATHGIARLSGERAWLDFATFAGAGFAPTPTSCGQLSSQSWAITGMSEGPLAFGGTGAAMTDFGRGVGAVTATTGGIYAYDVATNDRALGVLPTGSDFAPGNMTLRVRNDGPRAITALDLSYVIHVYNSQARANSFNVSVSTDGTTFTALTALNYTSPEAADTGAALRWVANPRSTSITGLNVAPGAFYFVRWSSADVSGAGSRDRFALDDVVLTPTYSPCGNGTLDAGELCDTGSANGTTPCGCTTSCTFAATGTACGGGTGGSCDAADTCDGAGTCVDRFATGTVCRPAVGACDAAETCNGTGVACPADGVAPAGTLCAPADPSLGCDVPDACDGTSGVCPSLVATAGTSCRASTGACDLGASCDGALAACPPSAPASAGTPCRASAGACDVAEACTGSSIACPPDAFAGAATTCRASAGPCDVAETCSGSSATCPTDRFTAAGTTCRPSSDACDLAETCSGTSAGCPDDRFAASGTTCRPAAGPCDVAEACSGASASCPADALAGAGTVCRPAVGVCDVAEACSGASIACPSDGTQPDGTACADSLACNGAEVCMAGSCSGTPVACDDDDACTADACAEPDGSCTHTPIEGCCTADAECDDGDPCTTDTCEANVCANVDTCAPDAGTMPVDAGMPRPDAGMPRDAGARDASTQADAGEPPPMMTSRCNCRVPGGPSPSGPALGLLALVGLALVARRRRG